MFETIKIILLLLPAVIETVTQLEKLFPESGKGQMKLELIKETLTNVSDVSAEAIPLIDKMVSTVVGIMNKFGVFKK